MLLGGQMNVNVNIKTRRLENSLWLNDSRLFGIKLIIQKSFSLKVKLIENTDVMERKIEESLSY